MGPEPTVLNRWLTGARGAYGVVLLLAPERVLSSLAGQPCDRPTMAVARVLGARELAQAAVLRSHPGGNWQLAGAGVDALHGASMLALAAIGERRYRRLALANARTAGLLALSCLMAADSARGRPGAARTPGRRPTSVWKCSRRRSR